MVRGVIAAEIATIACHIAPLLADKEARRCAALIPCPASENSLTGMGQFAVQVRQLPCFPPGNFAGWLAKPLLEIEKSSKSRCRTERFPARREFPAAVPPAVGWRSAHIAFTGCAIDGKQAHPSRGNTGSKSCERHWYAAPAALSADIW
jgi:hypothetical protein